MESTSRPAPQPIQPEERVQIIDILRGFALFGILLVNLYTYTTFGDNAAPADDIAMRIINFFGQGKFITIFSFLFGLGMAIMLLRSEERGTRFFPIYLRRMLALLAFGLIHLILIWDGDILTVYSILGLILLIFFRKCKPKTLIIWSCIWLGILVLLVIGFSVYLHFQLPEMLSSTGEVDISFGGLAGQTAIFSEGTYLDLVRYRLGEIGMLGTGTLLIAPVLLAMMNLGLYVGKSRLFANIESNLPLIRKIWWIGLIVGVAGNLMLAFADIIVRPENVSAGLIGLLLLGYVLGTPALCLFYMTSLVLMSRKPAWLRIMRPLASVGRMAITNYLMQSIICTTLFYGYAVGLYGKVGPALGILMTFAIYIIQIPISNWWLKRFRFGPVEWLWRTLTYLKPQPMRIKQPANE